MATHDAYLYDAVRTPFGRFGGALATTRPDDQGALVIRSIVDRHPYLDPTQIDEIIFGNATGRARRVAMSGGWPGCSRVCR